MRPYILKVSPGVEQDLFPGAAARVIALDADATVDVTVRDPDKSQEYTLKPGAVVGFESFDSLRVSHNGAVDTTITLYIGGVESFAQNAQVSGSVDISGGTVDVVSDVRQPANLFSADVSIAAAGNFALPILAETREILLQARDTNTADLIISYTSSTAFGPRLPPGASLSLRMTDLLYVHNTSGVAQLLSYLRFNQV